MFHAVPEWNEDDENADFELCFIYKGHRHWLSEFMVCENIPGFEDFDGYRSDSYFSGVLVKLCYGDYGTEYVKAYKYFS